MWIYIAHHRQSL